MECGREQMAAFMEAGLFSSAQMLGCFLVSSAPTSSEFNPSLKAENLVFLGDALFGQKEYRRAMSMYKQAMSYCRSYPRQASNNAKALFSASSWSPSPNSVPAGNIDESEVRYKISLCHCAVKEHRSALLEMEGIPARSRTLKMNLMIGKLYRICGNNRSAASCFKECLRACPYIFEAIRDLAELGASPKDITALWGQTVNKGGKLGIDYPDGLLWLNRYVEALCCIASYDHKGGLEIYSELLQRFPNNIHILLEMAKVQSAVGRNDEAILNFEKVRSIDPYVLTYMDEYAMLLHSKSDYHKLNKLVEDMLNIDHARAETVVALSALWERRDQQKALSYAEKSLQIDDRHLVGYIMKGNLCLSLQQWEAAVSSFRGAQEIRADLRSYQGLVHAYLRLNKSKDALFTAREAMKVMHQSAKALKLVGDVYAVSSTSREKARKFYESALRLEPGFLGAALALADLHINEGRNRDAVLLLEKYLKNWADDSLHIKLAQVFAEINMLSDALTHYQSAIRLNPQSEAAKKGLDRLEKQMKGIDPDANEEEEEQEVEEDVEPEDVEFL